MLSIDTQYIPTVGAATEMYFCDQTEYYRYFAILLKWYNEMLLIVLHSNDSPTLTPIAIMKGLGTQTGDATIIALEDVLGSNTNNTGIINDTSLVLKKYQLYTRQMCKNLAIQEKYRHHGTIEQPIPAAYRNYKNLDSAYMDDQKNRIFNQTEYNELANKPSIIPKTREKDLTDTINALIKHNRVLILEA